MVWMVMPGMWCLQDHGEEAEVKSQRDGEGWNLKSKILKKVCVCVHSIMKSYSHTWFSAIPWTVACQASLSMGFPRQEYWFGLSISSPTEEGQFSSVTQSYLTLYDPMDCSMPGFPVHHQLPELAQTHVHWVSDDIQPSHPLLSLPPPVFNFSQHQGLFQWVSSLHKVANYCSFSFSISISPSNEYWGQISFRIDWFNLLAVQGTLKNLLQYHSSEASILLCSAFFMVQLSRPYMTTGKTIALPRWIFVGKVMSLLSNVLSRFV